LISLVFLTFSQFGTHSAIESAAHQNERGITMKYLKNALVAVGLGLVLQASSQATIVNTWGYTVQSIWTAENPTGTPTGVFVDGTNKQLSWGAAALVDRSSLTISTDPTGTANTYVGVGIPGAAYIAAGSSLTHHKEPITGTTLQGATLRSTLSLFASGVANTGAATGPGAVNLNILFNETTNAPPCAVLSPTPCNDIFVLTTPLQNQSFVWDTETYYVNLFPVSDTLAWLSDAACATVGITTGISGQRCTGFTTPETNDTTLTFGFTVSTTPLSVPEPASVALTGLALALLAVRKRIWV
jgi:hypothetical protein